LALAECQVATDLGRVSVTVDEAESPLAWLARRRGRHGRPLIARSSSRPASVCAPILPERI